MKIEEFDNITMAYKRSIGEYGIQNQKLMEEIKEFLITNKLLNNKIIILGIALDNPLFIPAHELRYDVGFIIDEDAEIDLKTRKIDNGKYAIFEIPHTKQEISSFWQKISQLTTNLSIDDKKPIIERYDMNKIANHMCEFCIPLK